jgi:ABC-type branched-subunit amino acid transport system substrate-binding protein
MKGFKAVAVLSALWLVQGGAAFAAGKSYGPGVTDTEITVGQSVPYSGPASAFGIYGRVMVAYFEMVNEKGGINGRKVKLISLDNGYSPPKAIEDSRKLVEEMNVLAEVGTVGTPPNVAVQKYLNGKGVPQLFASAGGSRFNDPQNYRWTVPFYPGFAMEGAVFARYILKTKPGAKIAVLYQNDDYGKDYLKGLERGLGAGAAKSIVAEASYELSDPTVDSQVVSLQGAGADTVLEFATPKFAAQAIRKIANLGWKPLQIVGSPASSVNGVLKPAGFDNATGLLTSQFAKQPADPAWSKDQEVVDYLAFMKRWAPNEDAGDFVGLSGYINAEGVALVLRRCGDDLTRENLLKQATTIRNARVAMLLPGIDLGNSPSDYALYHKLRLARFDGTRWVLIGDAVSESD